MGMVPRSVDLIAERLQELGRELAQQGRAEDSLAVHFGALAMLFCEERQRRQPAGDGLQVPSQPGFRRYSGG
jgi:hypothetical protein